MNKTALFLCTGNSARSVLAECLLRDLSSELHLPEPWQTFSAGSHPTGQVNPLSLRVLREQGHAIDGLHSKSWDDFAERSFDLVVTVCDAAAGEVCPIGLTAARRLHWSFPDPAAVTGDEATRHAAFVETYHAIRDRLTAFLTSGDGA